MAKWRSFWRCIDFNQAQLGWIRGRIRFPSHLFVEIIRFFCVEIKVICFFLCNNVEASGKRQKGLFWPSCFLITMTSPSLFMLRSSNDVIFCSFQKGKATAWAPGRPWRHAPKHWPQLYFRFSFLIFFYARAAKQSRFRRARQKSRLQLWNKGHNKNKKSFSNVE